MRDVLVAAVRRFVTRADMVAGGDDLVEFMHRDACDMLSRDVARGGRVIIYPSLRIREMPSDVVDGIEISIRTLTAPVEFA